MGEWDRKTKTELKDSQVRLHLQKVNSGMCTWQTTLVHEKLQNSTKYGFWPGVPDLLNTSGFWCQIIRDQICLLGKHLHSLSLADRLLTSTCDVLGQMNHFSARAQSSLKDYLHLSDQSSRDYQDSIMVSVSHHGNFWWENRNKFSIDDSRLCWPAERNKQERLMDARHRRKGRNCQKGF